MTRGLKEAIGKHTLRVQYRDYTITCRYLYNCSKTIQNELTDIAVSSNKIENVLVLQGGGSLGAFACGVFKALANKNIRIDIVAAGTFIGGINAAIIAGSVDKEHPERTLEEFWLELAESSDQD